jgi:NAD(P) transhydrogenase subunit alpha
MVAVGAVTGYLSSTLGFIATVFAMINVVGGFMVTHRMLMMFKTK